MPKRLLSLVLSLVVAICSFATIVIPSNATTYEDQLKNLGFPSSYISSLVALHEKYPNWTFKPFKTGLDFDTAVNGERSTHSKQVISKSSSLNNAYYCNCSSCYKNGSYVYQEGSCVSASKSAVAYYMDPRNWLNETGIFQFESVAYNSAETISGIESILSGTFMHDAYITYVNVSGGTSTYKNSDGNKVKFSQAIMDGAKYSGLSAYYLAAKIVQEIGSTKANVGGTCGKREPFKSIFNYYSIGANGGASDGLHWADGKMWVANANGTTLYSTYDATTKKVSGTKKSVALHHYLAYQGTYGNYVKVKLYEKKGSNSYTTDGAVGYVLKTDTDLASLSYGRPWNNPYKTIYYGAKYIADGYLAFQNTLYLQKFNVNSKSGNLYSHEYLTNVNGALNASKISYNSYKRASLLSVKRTFYIPVYTDMPSKKSPVPAVIADTSDTTTTQAPTTTTTTVAKPKKVTGLVLSSRGAESLKVKWTAVSGATKYDVYLKSARTGKVYHKYVTTNLATLENLTDVNKYYIKVRAYKGSYGDYSATITEYTKPLKPPIKTPETNSKHQIIVKWSKVSCSGYQVQYSKKSDFSTLIATKTVSSSATSYIGKNFTKGRTYYVRVRAYKTVGDKKIYSSWSTAKKVVSK